MKQNSEQFCTNKVRRLWKWHIHIRGQHCVSLGKATFSRKPLHCLFRNQPCWVYFTVVAFSLGAFPLTGILILEVTKKLVWPIHMQDCFLFCCLVFSSQFSWWCRRSRQLNLCNTKAQRNHFLKGHLFKTLHDCRKRSPSWKEGPLER